MLKSRRGGGQKGKRPSTCRRRININVPGFTATRLLELRRVKDVCLQIRFSTYVPRVPPPAASARILR